MTWYTDQILQQEKMLRQKIWKISALKILKHCTNISAVENFSEEKPELVKAIDEKSKELNIPIIGITGTGGAGKSSLTDELVRRFLRSNTDKKIAIISIDPSKKKQEELFWETESV
jgi:putative protein kinase ArgK-like GTPase of G3E family